VVPLESIVGRDRVLAQVTTLAQACHASLLLVTDPPPPLLEQDVRAREEMLETGLLDQQVNNCVPARA
jgi:hypothetical protein